MNYKKCLFIQPQGIGDILFLQKAAFYFNNLGYHVYWPIAPQLFYIKDYLRKHKISWIKQGEEPDIKYNEVVDFQSADRYLHGPILKVKYDLIGQDYRDWDNYLEITRNTEKEEQLFNLLNLKDKKYTLINKKYGTPPNFKEKEVLIEGDNEIVETQFIEGFNVFDWCKVIEEADQISIVDTSLNWIIDKLELKAKKKFLISRHTPPNFREIDYVFKTDWTYINI